MFKSSASIRFNTTKISMCSAVALLVCFSPAASAQNDDETETSTRKLGTVTVTAQKREESQQDTPIAVSAFSQEALDERGLTDISNLASSVPSLTVQSNAGVIFINLRGAGNEINSLGADNGVGFHIDGVYIGNAVGSLVEMWDVERVEVLRGPQSTLFGRNTTGGSINIISQRPSDEFEAFGDLTIGDYGRVRARAAVNLPLSDNTALRLSGTREVRDGYTEARNPNVDDFDDRDTWFIRGQLETDLTDRFNVLLGIVANENDDASVAPERVGASYQSTGIPGFAGPAFGLPPGTDPFAALAGPKPVDPRVSNSDFGNYSNNETLGITTTAQYDFDSVILKSVTSYYDITRRTGTDFDTSELAFQAVQGTDESQQFSQEFQLLSDGGGDWEWILGAYYFHQDASRRTRITPSVFDIFGGFSAGGDLTTESYSVFGQATRHLSDRLSVTAGLRMSWDEKEGDDLFFIQLPNNPAGTIIMGGNTSDSWAEPTGKIGIDYKATDNSLLYATYSHGYRSGAINLTSPTAPPVDPEFVDAFEVGSKNRFFDDRFELNIAAHHTSYTDQQFTRFLPAGNQVIEAAGESTALGVEVDFAALPNDYLRFDGSVGWIDAEFDKFETSYGPTFGPILGFAPPDTVDLKGNKLTRTPEWSIALGAQVFVPVSFGDLSVRVDSVYRSEIFFDVFNTDVGSEDSFTKTDLRVLYATNDQAWTAEAFVQNIEDDDVTSNRVVNANVPIGFYAPPRTYGVRIGRRF